MLSLLEYADSVRNVCLDREVPQGDLTLLGGEEWRWRRYRRMVRRRLSDTIHHAFPRLEALLGESAMAALEDGFFDARPLKSVFIREVPGEFLAWFQRAAVGGPTAQPAHAVELARFEWTELVVAYEKDDPEGALAPLSMDARAVLTVAHRRLSLDHAVHLFDADEPREPVGRPTHLLVYREPETYDVRVLETSPVTNALLGELAAGAANLHDSIRAAAERERISVDRPFLEALAELLADLSERGVVLGAPER
jgi:hypothetical protein